MFTHLNVHSTYSKMRSTLRLEEIIALNQSQHVALTDVNTVRGFINFVQTSQSKNVRPIAGVNLITNVDEVVILVENDIGYENMCRLITDCHSDPNRSAADILKKYSNGLFVLAHKSSSLKSLKYIIPNDRLFVELRPGIQEPTARKLSKKYKLEMIATADVYFKDGLDHIYHKTLRAIDLNSTLDDLAIDDYKKEEHWFRNESDMICLLYTSPSPRDRRKSRMPSSA